MKYGISILIFLQTMKSDRARKYWRRLTGCRQNCNFLTDAYRCNFAFVSVTALIAASRDERPACINSPAVCAVETLFSRKDYLE